MLEMLSDVLNMHHHVLAYFVGVRRPELPSLTAQHDRPLGNGELRMTDSATWTCRA